MRNRKSDAFAPGLSQTETAPVFAAAQEKTAGQLAIVRLHFGESGQDLCGITVFSICFLSTFVIKYAHYFDRVSRRCGRDH
jgi:hypothetical protein